ncbi:hypothetical protein VTJ04DRAFT_3734 [Mycothermus thermophilus]|uniref:uncharacterized protein n=1 Tax=Humicola insolens TaxID=85995 RepID=UPI00374206C2
MKPALLLTLLTTAISGTIAWRLELTTPDNRVAKMHGSGQSLTCYNLRWSPALKINRAYFIREALPSSAKFELYKDKDCRGLTYKSGPGRHRFTTRVVKSYRIRKN